MAGIMPMMNVVVMMLLVPLMTAYYRARPKCLLMVFPSLVIIAIFIILPYL